ncbi:MAG: EscU/YscU/HrcU family type III secretion system export apparatus switch protein [Candidatus Cybelea sp.]
MSDVSEKPFEATPHRIAKARREGNVARSSELAANLSFAAGGVTTLAIAPLFGAVACDALAVAGSQHAAPPVAVVAVALLPAGAAACAGALGNLVQNGVVAFAISAKLERINPLEGIKRILSRETLAHSLRASLAFGCAVMAMAPFVGLAASAMLGSAALPQVAAAAWMAAREVCVAACAVGFCFAIAEYAAARKIWLRKLRMSFDERKREVKEEEGDAAARGRRRALHRALLRGGVRRLKDAAFVVANPQHVAVALEYRPPQVPVPRVLVRAVDTAAARVRAIAASYRIPIVENVWLARALYRDGRIGEPIPHVHYVAVAEIVAALLRANEIG